MTPKHGMIYGRSGVGKTCLLATALEVPELCPVLFTSTEARLESIEGKYEILNDIKNPNPEKLNVIISTSIEDCYQNSYLPLMRNIDQYKSWFIDSATELNYLTLKGKYESSGGVINFSKNVKSQYENYNDALHCTLQLFQALQLLPIHTWTTALTRPIEIPGEGIVTVYPSFYPETCSEKVSSKLDYVLYLESGIVSRTLICQPDGVHSAKDCSGIPPKLGRTIDNPTMKIIMDKLRQ